MSDDQPGPTLPRYSPPNPRGVPVADRKQSAFLFKAMRLLGKLPKGRIKIRGKGLQSKQTVSIKKRKQKFY